MAYDEFKSYEEASDFLQQFVKRLEARQVPMDSLEDEIDRANRAMAYCDQRLERINSKIRSTFQHESNEESGSD